MHLKFTQRQKSCKNLIISLKISLHWFRFFFQLGIGLSPSIRLISLTDFSILKLADFLFNLSWVKVLLILKIEPFHSWTCLRILIIYLFSRIPNAFQRFFFPKLETANLLQPHCITRLIWSEQKQYFILVDKFCLFLL